MKMFEDIDLNGNGIVTFNEYKEATISRLTEKFEEMAGGNNEASKADIKKWARKHEIPEEEIDAALPHIDTNGDGRMTLKEWLGAHGIIQED